VPYCVDIKVRKRKQDDLELFWTGGFESLTFVKDTVNQDKPINALAQSFHAWFTEQIERER
jgi:hypothetical protein